MTCRTHVIDELNPKMGVFARRNPLQNAQLQSARQLRIAVTRVSSAAGRSPEERPHIGSCEISCLSGERDALGHD